MPFGKTAFDALPEEEESNDLDSSGDEGGSKQEPEPEEDVEIIDEDTEGDDDDTDDDEGKDEPDKTAGKTKKDTTAEKILERHNGDPKAIAKEFAELSRTYGRHAQELGELRKAVQEMRESKETARQEPEKQVQAEDKPQVSDRGFPLDELGLEYIPPDYWKTQYVQQVKDAILERYPDLDDATATQEAIAAAARKRHEWSIDYEEQRRDALVKHREQQQQSIATLVEKQRERVAEVDKELIKNANLVVPAGKEREFIRTVKSEAAKVVEELQMAGSISDVEAASPEIVQGVYEMALGRLILSGRIGQSLTSDNGVVVPASTASTGTAVAGAKPKIRATRQEVELARALGIPVSEVIAERE